MIGIVGGTGRLGTALSKRLADGGVPVRIIARHEIDAAAAPAGQVEMATADVTAPASLLPALQGCSTVVSAITGFGGPGAPGARAIDQDGNLALIAAAEQAGVDRFVLVSVARASATSPVELFRAKAAAEDGVRSSGLAWAIVRPTAYLETWLEVIGKPLAETGRTRVFGRGRNPVNFVAVDDVARIVEAIVTGPFPTGTTVEVAGPVDLGLDALAHIVERTTGRPGRIDHVPLPLMRAMAAVLGPIRPAFADLIRAGILMDTADMRASVADRAARFPAIAPTPPEDVIRRLFGAVASGSVAA
jgi:uncharacterized protein YbjT (DUF2867 family)